jgi:hypothetical protein
MMSGSAAAAAAAIAEAIRASGVIVRVEPENFRSVLFRQEAPLVVYASGGFFSSKHQYLMSYKGLAFFCKSDSEIPLPGDVELIHAKKIWIPNM